MDNDNDNEYRERERERLALMGQLSRNRVNARLDRLAGIDSPAYGKFKCRDSEGGHTWVSGAAWRESGQACNKCTSRPIVTPYEVHAIHWFICRPCDRIWHDTNEVPRRCPNCRAEVPSSGLSRPIVFEPAEIDPNKIIVDAKEPHKMELCKKCLDLNDGRLMTDWVQCYKIRYWREFRAQARASVGEPAAAAAGENAPVFDAADH